MLDPDILAYYDKGEEDGRLGGLSVERIRTQELLLRHLPPAPSSGTTGGRRCGRRHASHVPAAS